MGDILVLAASEGVSAETIGEASLLLSDEEEENEAEEGMADAPGPVLAPLAVSARVDPLADGWRHLAGLNLCTELRRRVFTLRSAPTAV